MYEHRQEMGYNQRTVTPNDVFFLNINIIVVTIVTEFVAQCRF